MGMLDKLRRWKEYRRIDRESYLFARYYMLFCNDPKQYDKEMAKLARKNPAMAADFERRFQRILEAYKNKVEKETEEMEIEIARTYQSIEKGLEELERRKLGQKPERNDVGKEDENSISNS